jgi:hypothetical protein
MPKLSVPFDAWVGLVTASTGQEVTAVTYGNYTRQPAHMVWCADGVTIGNETTIVWGEALRDWGDITAVELWDAPSGGNRLPTALTAPLPVAAVVPVAQYSIARIPPAGLAVVFSSPLRSFGTGPFGVGPYGTTRSFAVVGAGVQLEITFDTSGHVCAPGVWSPGPFARAA